MKVLLVPGLGRTPVSMLLLARRLSKTGHSPEFFCYFPTFERQSRINERLVERLRVLAANGAEVGLIGHSFGGLLLREACAKVPELRVRHLVMLGTPNQPPRLAQRAYKSLVIRKLHGSCGRRLLTPEWYSQLPAPSAPYTNVAGTFGWPASYGPFSGEPNDGIVAVSETRINDDDDPLLMPVIHAFLLTDKHVFDVIADRLGAHGRGSR
jgi:pimeloyl-ACP methyl ester carboxylesterase